jgi:hypothetical protein
VIDQPLAHKEEDFPGLVFLSLAEGFVQGDGFADELHVFFPVISQLLETTIVQGLFLILEMHVDVFDQLIQNEAGFFPFETQFLHPDKAVEQLEQSRVLGIDVRQSQMVLFGEFKSFHVTSSKKYGPCLKWSIVYRQILENTYRILGLRLNKDPGQGLPIFVNRAK